MLLKGFHALDFALLVVLGSVTREWSWLLLHMSPLLDLDVFRSVLRLHMPVCVRVWQYAVRAVLYTMARQARECLLKKVTFSQAMYI